MRSLKGPGQSSPQRMRSACSSQGSASSGNTAGPRTGDGSGISLLPDPTRSRRRWPCSSRCRTASAPTPPVSSPQTRSRIEVRRSRCRSVSGRLALEHFGQQVLSHSRSLPENSAANRSGSGCPASDGAASFRRSRSTQSSDPRLRGWRSRPLTTSSPDPGRLCRSEPDSGHDAKE